MKDQHRVWEAIAESFDRSRTRRWPHVEEFLRGLSPGAQVLDLMAGNGRHTGSILEAGLHATWADWSRPLARLAAGRYPAARVAVADATALPFHDGSFDAVLLVAGLHSIPSAEGRAACLRESWRVLRPGGVIQVTVWSRDAPRFRSEGRPGEPLDVVIPWRGHGHDEPRAYHLYTRAALRSEVAASGLRIDREAKVGVVSEADNLVVVARRTA